MSEQTVTAAQRQAAAQLAAGRMVKDVATELGVSPRTVSRWSKGAGFRALVRRHREALLSEVPTAESVLTQALSAVNREGAPDWNARIAAAKALLSTPVANPQAQARARETRLYVLPDAEADEA